MPSVVSEASVSPHRAHHGAKQASSKGGKQAGGFEALLETTVPDIAPEKAPRPDKPEKAERAASSRGANEPDSEPSDLAPAAETETAPEATASGDGTDAEPDTETEATALPTEIDTPIDTSQSAATDENAAVVAAVIVQPTPQPVVAPVIAPAVTVATAPAAEDTTTDIPLTGVKPAGETAPAEPTKAAPPAAPVDAAAPDQAAPQEIKPQADKASVEESAADKSTTDKPAADKVKVQPVADENASGAKDNDGSLAEKKTAPEVPAIAKPETPAKPKVDAETTRSELDLTPREHAAKTNTDTAQTATLSTTQTQASQSAATMSPATQQTAIAVPVAGLALEIAAQSRAGKSRFEIRLDPPELGRIDVRLDMDKDGNVTSRMIVERSETLDLLRRDAQQLERMLNQAGLKTADNALEFQLRDQGFAQNGDNSRNNRDASQIIIPDDQSPVLDAARGYGRLLGLGNGLDISV